MLAWTDPFTGVTYEMAGTWVQEVRRHLTRLLCDRLQALTDAKNAADLCARFWRDYYELVFPLRFGSSRNGDGLFGGCPLFQEPNGIQLDRYLDRGLRCSFLDGTRLPPLLAASHASAELVADHHLTCAAVTNVVLRAQGVTEELLLHQVRLGVLLHELSDEEPLKSWMQEHFPQAWQTAQFLCGEGAPPEGADGALLNSLHTGQVAESLQLPEVFLVAVDAQRIKRFVFESPGLNEIRGASTLLDECVARSREIVGAELGPEVVIRAAASTLEFLAPSEVDERGVKWTGRLRDYFHRRTGTAFIAAAAHAVAPGRLLTEFSGQMRALHVKLERERYRADLPMTDALPFELRCGLCRARPAEGWYEPPEGGSAPACRVCYTKRTTGRDERGRKVSELLKSVGLSPSDVGVRGSDPVADKLEELTPDGVRRDLLAVVYGDGNNFGGVVSKLPSLALSLQWTHRVEKTTRAAVALALARATEEAANEEPDRRLEKLPFQVLALGGDDLSLLMWGRIGLRFCEQFLTLTDTEFQTGRGERLNEKPLSFSLGALFCDEKAPVRRTVDFAESELLRWAKRAVRQQGQGNLAFLLAMTAEQIPADLNEYRKKMFLRGDKLCLTLRPLTANELGFLLDKACQLKKQHSGRLHRLVEAFVQSPPGAAMLHYIYQKEREKGRGIFATLEIPEDDWKRLFGNRPLPAHPLSSRPLFGENDGRTHILWYSPLWDLLEMVKILE